MSIIRHEFGRQDEKMHGAYRILTVSKLWVTVTAPHAAIPPAMKELHVD